jgi:peptidyl-dipeptidase A
MRNEEGFDGGTIYHLANNIPVIQYFNALIYQFQFYRELCLVAKQYEPGNKDKPLYRCNLYGSKEAGKKLFEMLSLGCSKPWPQVNLSLCSYILFHGRNIKELFTSILPKP